MSDSVVVIGGGIAGVQAALDLAEAGAKVLNAQAVEFAKEKGIAIYARATSGPLPGPDPSSDGTVVRKHPPRMPGAVAGVASERDLLVLESDAAPADLLALLDERGVSGKQLHVASGATHLAVSRDNLHDEARLRDRALSVLEQVGLARLAGGRPNADNQTILAFLERALEDFRQRLPAAARDAGQGSGWRWEPFFAWIADRVEQNRALLDAWVATGALKPVPRPAPLRGARPAGLDEALWASLERYLTYDGWREPYYSDVEPVCALGASAVYFLRKGPRRE